MVKRDQTEEKLSFILGIPKNSYLIVFMHKGFADVFDMGGLREESAACPLPASLALEMFAVEGPGASHGWCTLFPAFYRVCTSCCRRCCQSQAMTMALQLQKLLPNCTGLIDTGVLSHWLWLPEMPITSGSKFAISQHFVASLMVFVVQGKDLEWRKGFLATAGS